MACRSSTNRASLPSADLPQLSQVVSFKPGVGQNIALHALSTVMNSAFLISAIPVDLPPPPTPPPACEIFPNLKVTCQEQYITIIIVIVKLAFVESNFSLTHDHRGTMHRVSN